MPRLSGHRPSFEHPWRGQVNDQSRSRHPQSADFMPGPAAFGENREEDTSWKHSDSPYSSDRTPYIGPADDGQPDGNRARRAGVQTRPARWRARSRRDAVRSLRGAEEDDL